jgi:hypothetical protein
VKLGGIWTLVARPLGKPRCLSSVFGLELNEQFGSLRGRDDASPYFSVGAKLLREYEFLGVTMKTRFLSVRKLRSSEPAREFLASPEYGPT